MLRYEPPILFVSRVVSADLEWAGVAVHKGDLVHLGLASANRDPEHWGHPDTFEVGRTVIRNLSFGWGMHFCLGAGSRAWRAASRSRRCSRAPAKIEWAGPPAVWAPATALRTLEAFPVRLTPA
jgi:cytochrome P450